MVIKGAKPHVKITGLNMNVNFMITYTFVAGKFFESDNYNYLESVL